MGYLLFTTVFMIYLHALSEPVKYMYLYELLIVSQDSEEYTHDDIMDYCWYFERKWSKSTPPTMLNINIVSGVVVRTLHLL